MDPNTRIGFLGMGKMAQALCRGFISKGLITPDRVIGSKATTSGLDQGLLKQFLAEGVTICQDNARVVEFSNVIIIAVKPHIVPDVLQEIGAKLTANHLIISVAVGLKIEKLQQLIAENGSHRIINSMPNTPSEICEGATVYTMGPHATSEDERTADQLFSAVGYCCKVTEPQMQVALSGVTPALVFMFIDALADGGVMMGMPRNLAITLAAQAIKGSAALQMETGLHPGELKDRVCSPGGTTIRCVQALEDAGFRAAIIKAVQAGTERTLEIGKQ